MGEITELKSEGQGFFELNSLFAQPLSLRCFFLKNANGRKRHAPSAVFYEFSRLEQNLNTNVLTLKLFGLLCQKQSRSQTQFGNEILPFGNEIAFLYSVSEVLLLTLKLFGLLCQIWYILRPYNWVV